MLYRTVFQGQHGGGGLLEASDKDFKVHMTTCLLDAIGNPPVLSLSGRIAPKKVAGEGAL